MRLLTKYWRLWLGLLLFIVSELVLFGASEGAQKWGWIEAGTLPNAILALGFIVRRHRIDTAL